jgi:hypothetical protein
VKFVRMCVIMSCVLGLVACATPAKRVKNMRLGMTPDEVRKKMGDPFTVRASKVFADGQTMEIWEYVAWFTILPKDFWVYFENGKVVQWGQPGDFSGSQATPGVDPYVDPYKPTREQR